MPAAWAVRMSMAESPTKSKGQNLLGHRRIGLQRHALALPQHSLEADVGKERPDYFFGARLELVGGYGQLHAPADEFGEQFGNAGVGFGADVEVVGVVGYEVGPHQRHVFRRPQRLGQGPFDQPHDAVAHETAVGFVGVLRQSAQSERRVAGHGQVADRVDQRAVEIENRQSGFHDLRRMRHPRAATRSDIRGLAMLKMQ